MSEPWDGPDYVDRGMAKAMSHPLRIQILAELNQAVMSPSEFSERFEMPLSNVSYHFRQLEKWECIKCVGQRQVRGAMESFYEARKRVLFDGKPWENLPESVRASVTGQIFSDFLGATATAMLAETVDARKDRHTSWTQAELDEEGWMEAAKAFREMLRRMVRITEKAQDRLAESGESGLVGTYALFLFESPRPEPPAGDLPGPLGA
jgi:DNA-binding transcriptional ArsR family regulator